MEWNDTAVVLKVGTFKESDLWVRLLTKKHGLLTAFAFGGRKSKNRFPGCLDSFNILDISTETSRNGHFIYLKEACFKDNFPNLRTNWKTQGMAANIIRFLEKLCITLDSSATIYNLVIQFFHALNTQNTISEYLPFFFRLRVIKHLGFLPDLEYCCHCAYPLSSFAWGYFIVSEGTISCPLCHNHQLHALILDQDAISVLKTIAVTSPAEWNTLFFSQKSGRQIYKMINDFIEFHLDIESEKDKRSTG